MSHSAPVCMGGGVITTYMSHSACGGVGGVITTFMSLSTSVCGEGGGYHYFCESHMVFSLADVRNPQSLPSDLQ